MDQAAHTYTWKPIECAGVHIVETCLQHVEHTWKLALHHLN